MKNKSWKLKTEYIAEVLFFLLVVGFMIALACAQTFGDPPDEINRFKVAYYIFYHGKLPIGSDPEILLDGYGASYAFQPILTYILQAWVMKLVALFTMDSYALVLAARLVNVAMGAGMVVVVRKLSKALWEDAKIGWMFSLFVMLLPQHLFLYTYINTDAMALLGSGLILLEMIKGQKDDFSIGTSVYLSIGIILVAMSYYNAYGIVLLAGIWILLVLGAKGDRQLLLKRVGLMCGIVLAGIAWWFIRNAVLYQGDFLGMNARQLCAMETALPEYNPLTRFTYAKSGTSVLEMLQTTPYIALTYQSFIAMFGAMNIPTHGLIYIFYGWLLGGCLVLTLLPTGGKQLFRGRNRLVWNLLLVADMIITMGLHLYYSYTWEYQPQGRYLMPMILALMYFVTLGLAKLGDGQQLLVQKVGEKAAKVYGLLYRLMLLGIGLFIVAVLVYTISRKVLPVYVAENSLKALHQVAFSQIMP